MALDTTRYEQIREVTASRSEQDILDYVKRQEDGAEGVLDEIFGNMVHYFQPERARGQNADFQYHIKTSDGVHEYFVKVHDGKCETGRGTVDSPRLTTTVSITTFLRLVAGRLNGMQAFLSGKVKLKGNTLYASKFEHWFDRPS